MIELGEETRRLIAILAFAGAILRRYAEARYGPLGRR